MKVAVEKLREYMLDAAQALPMDRTDASYMVDNLISANQWGVNSHGVGRFPIYMKRLSKGLVNRQPDIKIIRKYPATMAIDGDNGLGAVVTIRAFDEAMKLADVYGVGIATVKNSNHFGAAGYYCNYAADKGYVSLICTVGPANMPPFGGMEPYFSTNPLAIGMPCKERPHIILDIATAMAAKGKIREALRKGESIPLGWAIDKDGNPTTDAKAACDGLVLPMAGHKGSGLALAIEYLAGVLSGSAFGPRVKLQYGDDPDPANVGHSLIVYKPDAFLDKEEYEERLQIFKDELHAIRPASGFDRVLLPGEKEIETQKRVNEQGIEIDPGLYAQLQEISQITGVALPF